MSISLISFRDDPPSQSVSIATQELMRLIEANPSGLPGLDPIKDLHVRDISLVEQFRALQLMEEAFSKYQCIHCPNFEDHVSIPFFIGNITEHLVFWDLNLC